MSALPSTVQHQPESASVNDAFLKYLPAVERHATISFRHMRPVDREEAVAEATAAAFVNFKAISRRGKANAVTPSTLAQFAVLHTQDHRHVGGNRESRRDAMSRHAQRRHGFKVLGLPWDNEQLDLLKKTNPEVWRLNLMHDARTPVSDQAAFRIDLSCFLATQHDRTRKAAAMLAAGHKRCEVAEHLGTAPSAVTQRMNRARREWKVFRGE